MHFRDAEVVKALAPCNAAAQALIATDCDAIRGSDRETAKNSFDAFEALSA